MKPPAPLERNPASYKDPAGFIFQQNGVVYRQVNKCHQSHYEFFISSGLYEKLVSQSKLLRHRELRQNITGDAAWFLTLIPEPLRFVSYPYEWSFDMLKDAALLTLEIAETALQHGMILKDATPFNVQWHEGRMVFIDTLSFEQRKEEAAWIAYRQFCESFLAPLALMHYTKLPLQPLLLAYPEGLPLHYAHKLLPWQSRWNMHLYLHVHLNAKYAGKPLTKSRIKPLSSQKLSHIFRSLTELVKAFSLNYKGTWAHYYSEAGRREGYLDRKRIVLGEWIENVENVATAIDTGANDGSFSALLQRKGIYTLSADSDHFAANKLYLAAKEKGNALVHPLVIDFAAPSPASGLNNTEHRSLFDRVNADLVLSLAFIHHLAIGKNIPFEDLARLFLSLGHQLIIEFVDVEDEKIVFMLQQKSTIYSWYSKDNFQQVFGRYYTTLAVQDLSDTRTLYLMKPHEAAPATATS
ncbi:MAG: hypothetical protein WKF70_01620 [Chitinophagaceae bacterium]